MAATWCQKMVSGCDCNMVSEEGQWLWLECGVRRRSVAVDRTWCQKMVIGCGCNMVSEVGQGLCMKHGVRRGSMAVDRTWCQKRVCRYTCSFNHVLYSPRDITTHSPLHCDNTVTTQSQMTLLHSPMSYAVYVTSQCIHHCTVTTRSQSTLMQSLIIMSCALSS